MLHHQAPPPMAQLIQQQPTYPVQPQEQPQGYRMTKLICSFKSGLPNEIDFAMQVATLLANTDNFTWSKDYPLVEAICSSLHVYTCTCGETPPCYCYPRFWLKILNTNNQFIKLATAPPEKGYMNFDNLTNLDPKDQARIYKRIKSTAELIKQFSMTTGNEKSDQDVYKYRQKKLKASPSLLKFVSLLLHCSDVPLNFIGLDILSNTASKLAKVNNDNTCKQLVLLFQERCINSICTPDGDIHVVNRSIEVVSKLVSSSSICKLITEKGLVLRLEQFLTSNHDVTLFLSALECCHKISRSQPQLMRAAKYSLKIFVNLLNCDDLQYFTPNALKRIKLSPVDLPTSGSKNHRQSPLSVSVRLTAALILRNMAMDGEIKQALKKYEPLLSEICMDGRDESKIIAECLSLI